MVDKVVKPATKTIADIIDSDIQFTKVAAALREANMLDSLTQEGQLTFFAPVFSLYLVFITIRLLSV